MEAILRVSRSRQHALTTALRVDMAYLCVGERTVFSLLLAPLFSVIFQGEAYGDGFGYRMGVIMTVFTCAMWVLTMAVADLQNGYRLRGIIPASRKSQVAARYVVGLVISVLSIAMIVLIDGLQVLVNPDWSFAGNLWVAPLGGFCTALMVALIVPTGYLWTKLGGLQVTMMVIYVVVLAVSILLSILPASVTRGLAHAANAIIAQRLWLVIAVLTTTVVAYGISYVIASRIFASREADSTTSHETTDATASSLSDRTSASNPVAYVCEPSTTSAGSCASSSGPPLTRRNDSSNSSFGPV